MRTALFLVAVALIAPGCSRRQCVPADVADRKYVDVSCDAEAHAPVAPSRIREVETEFYRRTALTAPAARPYQFLALSGGGMYGAYGVGVLTGWTESGTRPEFDAVTGISTGALMSTFAFLGPRYDATLYEAMVGVERSDILGLRFRPGPLVTQSVFHNRPIRRMLEQYVTAEILVEVAAAHAAGRRLYVGTTNIDSRKLILWDMGAIASRGTPESLELYRTILLASASVPVAFPPVRIPVEVDGRCYEETHVDGGASDGVIFRPFMVADLNRANGLPGAVAPPGSVLYIINNGKVYADPSCVSPNVASLLSATARSIMYGKTRDEHYRIYLNCLETGVLYRWTAIPREVPVGSAGPLGVDDASQREFHRLGVEAGRLPGQAPNWRDLPAGTDTSEQTMPRTGTRFVTVPR